MIELVSESANMADYFDMSEDNRSGKNIKRSMEVTEKKFQKLEKYNMYMEKTWSIQKL